MVQRCEKIVVDKKDFKGFNKLLFIIFIFFEGNEIIDMTTNQNEIDGRNRIFVLNDWTDGLTSRYVFYLYFIKKHCILIWLINYSDNITNS